MGGLSAKSSQPVPASQLQAITCATNVGFDTQRGQAPDVQPDVQQLTAPVAEAVITQLKDKLVTEDEIQMDLSNRIASSPVCLLYFLR